MQNFYNKLSTGQIVIFWAIGIMIGILLGAFFDKLRLPDICDIAPLLIIVLICIFLQLGRIKSIKEKKE